MTMTLRASISSEPNWNLIWWQSSQQVSIFVSKPTKGIGGGGGQVFSWVGSECTTSSNFGWIVDDTVVGYACKSKLLDDCIELYRNSACTG